VRLVRVGDLPTAPPPAAAQIIDNGDPGFSTSGNWYAYPGQGYQNDVHYAWPGSGGTAQWTAQLPAGQYQVALTWSPQENRATNASFTVRDGGTSLGTTPINQQLAPAGFADQGFTWQTLGNFNVTSGGLTVLTTDVANGAVIADAIRLQRIGDVVTNPTPAVQVIDNGDAGFAATGTWIAWPGQGYQNDVHYTFAGPGTNTAQWTATVAPGRYRVSVTWSSYWNRATDAPFTVSAGGVSLGTTRINQRLDPNDFAADGVAWESLGTFDVTGNSLAVILGQGNDHVIADAVRIERIDGVFANGSALDDLLADALLDPLLG
jgi:hypothetical protein